LPSTVAGAINRGIVHENKPAIFGMADIDLRGFESALNRIQYSW
ncbi:unnamed protein product, partial [marine sediment metagenome]